MRNPLALTERERQILDLGAAGRTGQQTADELGIKERTVEGHRNSLFQKLGADNMAHAVYLAMKKGIL